MDYVHKVDPYDTLLVEYKYLDKERIGKVLYQIGLTESKLNEGVFDMPIAKVKSWFEKMKSFMKKPEDMLQDKGKMRTVQNALKPVEMIANRTTPAQVRTNLNAMAAKGGIDTGTVQSVERDFFKILGAAGIALHLITRLGLFLIAIAILTALVTKKPLKQIGEELRRQLEVAQRKGAAKPNDSPIIRAVKMGGLAWKYALFFFWFPPMWFAVGLMALVALVWFWQGVFETIFAH
jgi:hypothetical protein